MSILGDISGLPVRWWDEYGVGTAAQAQDPALNQLTGALNASSQAHAAAIYNQALQNQLAAAQVTSRRPQPLFISNVAMEKLEAQVQELVRQLPMSIAAHIAHCGYYEKDHEEAARFVIIFNNDRTLTFYDVDNFPSAEHIGRIALECP